MSDWQVELCEDNVSEFYVTFRGPKDSELLRRESELSGVRRQGSSELMTQRALRAGPYEGGVWRVHVEVRVVLGFLQQWDPCMSFHAPGC